jgi:cytidylate kinase
MRVWTISWQEGTGGDAVGHRLAEEAGVRPVEDDVVASVAAAQGLDVEHMCAFERHLPGRLLEFGLTMAMTAGHSAEAAVELRRVKRTRELTEFVVREAAREPCVILGRAGFAILRDHPGALHIRLHAPLEWRIREFARTRCLPLEHARRLVVSDDRARETYVRRLYGLDLHDDENFDLVWDASRIPQETMVEMALVAAHRRGLSAVAGA